MGKHKSITVSKLYAKRKLVATLAGIFGILCGLIILLAYFGQNIGSFTIRLDDELSERQIYLSTDKDFAWKDSRLEAKAVTDAIPTYKHFVREDICKANDGSYVGISNSYVGFTFYMLNDSDVAIDIEETFKMVKATNGLDETLWAWYFEDDELYGNVYHKKDAVEDYTYPEDYTNLNEFESDTVVFTKRLSKLEPHQVKKITLIMWVDCYDPDLNDGKLSGTARFTLTFSVFKDEEL